MSSENIDSNVSSSGFSSGSIILKEEFNDGFEPTQEEINDYAIRIGIDPSKEPFLLHIARDGLIRPLPSDWKPCFDATQKACYYVNKITKKTQWEHPLDAEYKLLVEKTRRRHYDLSDNLSELDSGIRSLQGNDEGGDTTPESSTPGQMKVEQTIFGPPKGAFSVGNRDRIQLAPLEPLPLRTTNPIRKVGKFEISKSPFSPPNQIGLSISAAPASERPITGLPPKGGSQSTVESPVRKGFSLTGGGSSFLKSSTARKDESSQQSSATSKPIDIESRQRDIFTTSPGGVRSILRDSSLTDVRSRPSVRFNLNADVIKGSSPSDGDEKNSSPEDVDEDIDDDDEQDSDENDAWDIVDEGASTHVKQVKVTPAISPISPVTQLAILRSGNHASETIKKTTLKGFSAPHDDKPSIFSLFDKVDERGKGAAMTASKVKPMYPDDTTDSESKETESAAAKDHEKLEKMVDDEKQKYKAALEEKLSRLKRDHEVALERELKAEENRFKALLNAKKKEIEEKHLVDVLDAKREAEAKLTEIKMGIKQQNEEDLEHFKAKLEAEFEERRRQINEEYRNATELLQKNHNEMLEELERDLKLELEIIRKEHSQKLMEARASVEHEIETERQRMRESGEDRLYEKVRCEKRLLEDKYRCLKEKYMKLKNDIRISMERKKEKGRREQQSIATTVSEASNNKSDENQSGAGGKPPMGIVNSAKHQLKLAAEDAVTANNRPAPSNKHLKFVQNDETSISQSDTTISNQYVRRSRLSVPNNQTENGNSDSEAFDGSISRNDYSRHNQNNNNTIYPNSGGASSARQKRRLAARSKSASTSRLPSVELIERPCTPVENLRDQLQQLEDLEDQFPETTLDSPYRLRYPFSDIGNQGGGSSELDFFKHRIHLEKDSVRRAKESLRAQRTNFRAKQREIKQRHSSAARHTMDQLILEEKELTEMEVSLHRTRALLGEKVIRLRHLEHSLQRLYEKEKPLDLLDDNTKATNRREDATLSDVSSHSSSGFSSTDFHTDNAAMHSQKKDMLQESSEIMQSLENLNAEIREIWEILSKQQTHGLPPPPPIETEIKWTMFGAGAHQPSTAIPTLADRLETYRHITGRNTNPFITTASSVANTIVSQAPLAAHYTTSLVERTRDLRNWLKQAKTENEVLNAMGQQTTI